jgi:hypothetical protein
MPQSVLENWLLPSILSAITEPGLLSKLLSGLMISKEGNSVWTSGMSFISLIRNFSFNFSPYVIDATIPIVNYTESAMTSVITVEQARTALKTNLKNLTA